jgi:hypothetical protein
MMTSTSHYRIQRQEAFAASPAGFEASEDLKSARHIVRDRRTSFRFPLESPAELRTKKKVIRGTTLNISSGGLLMSCSDGELTIGTRVKVNVHVATWLDASTKEHELLLIVEGAIVRKSAGYVAVQRKHYKVRRNLILNP